MTTETLILIWGAFALLSSIIGASKGRGGEGFALGLLLGLIGVIITLCLKPATPTPTAATTTAGWWPDPHGRHQHRYWDGTRWTPNVSDAGVTSIEG